jgi:hypothetical protein
LRRVKSFGEASDIRQRRVNPDRQWSNLDVMTRRLIPARRTQCHRQKVIAGV